jgi:hypothetical protein
VPNTKAYQWEYMDLEPGVRNLGTAIRGAYLDHVADWAPRGRTTRDCTWVSSWAELGVTGTWPRAVSLWEHGSLAVLARRLEMAQNVHQADPEDKALEAWVEKARTMRYEIVCKLLLPAPWSPTLEELVAAKVTGGIYYQQTVKTVPRRVEQYLAALEAEGLALAQGLGMRLVGAFRTGLCNDSEAVVIWALDDFDHWAAVENANRSDAVRRWRSQLSGVVRDWENVLLMPAPKAPLQTGRIL